MHINYLILAHANYNHLQKLINAINGPNISIYIHIDKKAKKKFTSNLPNVVLLDTQTSIYWGGFGMIQATLNLIERARKDNNGGYYILLSGADYPIRSNQELQLKLKSGKEFINILQGPLVHKPLERYQYYYFDIDRRNPTGIKYYFFRVVEKLQLKLRIIRRIPFPLFVGSQWFALTEECIDHILHTINTNDSFLKYFKNVYIPDEAFFQTIIGNSKFYENVEGNLTYVDWDANPGPAMIQEKHINLFKTKKLFKTKYGEHEPFFARKFDDKSKSLIPIIDKELLGSSEK